MAFLHVTALSTKAHTSKALNAFTTCGYAMPCAFCAKNIPKYAYLAKKKPRPGSGLPQMTILKASRKLVLPRRKRIMSKSISQLMRGEIWAITGSSLKELCQERR